MAQVTVPARARSRDSNGAIAYQMPQQRWRQPGAGAGAGGGRMPRSSGPGNQPSAAAAVTFLRDVPLTGDQRTAIGHRTAERVFGIA
jgi:hypothetical protein